MTDPRETTELRDPGHLPPAPGIHPVRVTVPERVPANLPEGIWRVVNGRQVFEPIGTPIPRSLLCPVRWQTEAPTKPWGFWWARGRVNKDSPTPEVVQVAPWGERLLAWVPGLAVYYELSEFAAWAGPLAPPEE